MFNTVEKKMKKFCACFSKGAEDKEREEVTLRRKMVIVGDGECGKTCLVTRMSTGSFVDIGYIPTVFETEVVSVSTGSENVELVMFDTAGQEDYDRLRPFSYTDVDVVLICFSLADHDTLTNVVENWSPEIRYFCGNVPVILVGNKKDLRDAESSRSSSKGSLLDARPTTTTRDPSVDSERIKSSGSTSSSSNDDFPTTNRKSSSPEELTSASSRSASPTTAGATTDPAANNATADDIPTTSNSLTSNTRSTPHETVADDISSHNRRSALYETSTDAGNRKKKNHVFYAGAPVKHSEGVIVAKRIGAMAYFETSALTGDSVEELLLATTKAAVLGTKKSKKFKPFTNTMTSWRSLGALSASK